MTEILRRGSGDSFNERRVNRNWRFRGGSLPILVSRNWRKRWYMVGCEWQSGSYFISPSLNLYTTASNCQEAQYDMQKPEIFFYILIYQYFTIRIVRKSLPNGGCVVQDPVWIDRGALPNPAVHDGNGRIFRYDASLFYYDHHTFAHSQSTFILPLHQLLNCTHSEMSLAIAA